MPGVTPGRFTHSLRQVQPRVGSPILYALVLKTGAYHQRVSKLVLYAQSAGTVISGRITREVTSKGTEPEKVGFCF